jgi:hypothetical protein
MVACEEIVAIEEPKDTEVVDIMTALRQSIEKTKKRPMEKVSAEKASAKEEAGESKKSKTKAKTKAKAKTKRRTAA